MDDSETMAITICSLLHQCYADTKYFEKNFFLLKEGDDIYEITVKGNIDPGAWEDDDD